MIDDVSDISSYYNQNPDYEHNRLVRHQLEYEVTQRYLSRYLPARGAVLEVGAATGRYTLGLAQHGYQVTAVDMSAGLLDLCRKRIAAAGLEHKVRFVLADARDLSKVEARDFDAVLLMGPLYHLILEADRRQALQEVVDRLRPGGVLFSAFISRYGVLGDLVKNDPGWIEEPAEVHSLMTHGRRPDDSPRGGFRGYFACASEIAPLHELLGLETLILAGVDPCISADDESYNQLEGMVRQQWLDLFFKVSSEPSIIGASRHFLYIGRKK